MNKLEKIAVVVVQVAFIAFLGFIAGAFFAVHTMTEGNLRSAAKHIAIIDPAIRADSRFQKAILHTHPRGHGCISVDGEVASDQALNDLQHLMNNSRPPVLVMWGVVVSPDESAPK